MSKDIDIVNQLALQHPLHGVVGEIYQEKGGKDFLRQWADDNENSFVKLLFGTIPTMQPVPMVQGDVHLHVHPALAPTELDVVSEQ